MCVVLPHARDELLTLAAGCVLEDWDTVNGWAVDLWRMTGDDVDAATAAYKALLAASSSPTHPVAELLANSGIDLEALLLDSEDSKDDITRSDVTELIATASMIEYDGATLDTAHMPNVPKMARKKSDSGVDVFDVELIHPSGDLLVPEALSLASVKHTIDGTTQGLRWKLASSLGSKELSRPYLTAQLRVLKGRLEQEGMSHDQAMRAFLFTRDFPDPDFVKLFAVAVVDPAVEEDIHHHVSLLPEVEGGNYQFRIVLCPGLSSLHEKCV